ncbi:hypothetical protein FD50_GL001334 [Liquorilactobacillus satsumensis DSM 16230 = JCM 12392]|uniref:Uncharacterized protein n=1 Tax=Liquorilactobacillus satsumensis DSM 16230 = JCM 12392 TaxID=1423801 RepID=A0A0R1UVW2_9LACO|nr:hypothetical protein FD50_GL001334 [Liquorilactobacillus satsumensis DSM 16230 = JCM 12392]
MIWWKVAEVDQVAVLERKKDEKGLFGNHWIYRNFLWSWFFSGNDLAAVSSSKN